MDRPATVAQFVIGLLLLKHITGLSDEGIVQEVLANPYMQAFCGFEKFVTEERLDPKYTDANAGVVGIGVFKRVREKDA